MTTRQMLDGRFYRGILCVIAIALPIGIWQSTVPDWTTNTYVIGIGLLSLGAVMRYKWVTECVHCHKELGWMAITWRPAQDANTSPPCPHCGVSIDRDAPT
jgi:predicted RNA-binding Zn-ribbon protein involved in translation (DUF1610 family)